MIKVIALSRMSILLHWVMVDALVVSLSTYNIACIHKAICLSMISADWLKVVESCSWAALICP